MGVFVTASTSQCISLFLVSIWCSGADSPHDLPMCQTKHRLRDIWDSSY